MRGSAHDLGLHLLDRWRTIFILRFLAIQPNTQSVIFLFIVSSRTF